VSFTIHHITLNVSDLERARAFYEGVLGLRVDRDFPGEKVRLRLDGRPPGWYWCPRFQVRRPVTGG
jgi:catechol 2,3-dioxygenase-like lactoylglutathione lyase family enzyme